MPPSIKVNTKRPKVLFKQKASSNNDLMRPDRTRIKSTTTGATTTTATAATAATVATAATAATAATTTTTATSTRTLHQSLSRLRLGKLPKSGTALDERTTRRASRDRVMDPAGIGKTSDVTDENTMLGIDQNGNSIPELFTSLPPLRDSLETKTSRVQDETVQDCLPLLAGVHDPSRNLFDFNAHGLPRLEREKHVKYLRNCLKELPAGFVVHDASRPWILYWVMAGLCLLGEDVQQYRTRLGALKRAPKCPFTFLER